MPTTLTTDIQIPENWADYVIERTAELSAFLSSPIIEDVSETIGSQLASGLTVNMPFFKDLSGDDDQYDDDNDLVVNNIETGDDIAHVILRAKAFGSSDLSADLAGADPINAIADLFAGYWARRKQAVLVATLKGVMGAASMSQNVLDISGATGAAALIDSEAVIDAAGLMGDASGRLTGVAMHSKTKGYLEKLNLIETERDSDGRTFVTYRGKPVVEDDGLPVDDNSGDPICTTYLFGPGAIGYGEALPKNPAEPGRDALKASGMEFIVNRTRFVVHPRGVQFKGTPSGKGPTNAELAVGTNWERVYEPKNVRLVALKHKIG